MIPFLVPEGPPCLDCAGSALVALCGRLDNGSDGPCVLAPHSPKYPCYGAADVASDWSPAVACRACCVCPCGSTDDGTSCSFCGVRMRPGVQPPVFDPSTHRPAP